jgi:hypothetical protein
MAPLFGRVGLARLNVGFTCGLFYEIVVTGESPHLSRSVTAHGPTANLFYTVEQPRDYLHAVTTRYNTTTMRYDNVATSPCVRKRNANFWAGCAKDLSRLRGKTLP